MADFPKEPTVQDLLSRVARLEEDNSKLLTQLTNLEAHWGKRMDGVHGILDKLIDKTGSLNEHVIELMEKVFPGYAYTQVQIMNIFDPNDSAD